MNKEIKTFSPFTLPSVSQGTYNDAKLTCTTTIRGNAAREFEKICNESGLNRSQLLTQMVYHCLNRSEELKEFYRRVAVMGK